MVSMHAQISSFLTTLSVYTHLRPPAPHTFGHIIESRRCERKTLKNKTGEEETRKPVEANLPAEPGKKRTNDALVTPATN